MKCGVLCYATPCSLVEFYNVLEEGITSSYGIEEYARTFEKFYQTTWCHIADSYFLPYSDTA
jgi:hypothetical protein